MTDQDYMTEGAEVNAIKQTAFSVEELGVQRSVKKVSKQLTLGGEPTPKAKPDPRNRLNNLTNREWIFFTRSTWFTSFPREIGFKLRNQHGGNKPPALMKHLIEFFTKRDEVVLDPMCGVGGTLLGASLAGRKAVGIEINGEWTKIYATVCKEAHITPQTTFNGDCIETMRKMRSSFDFIVVDPPYRENTFNPNVSGVRKQAFANGEKMTSLTESFSTDKRDFGNSESYENYMSRLTTMFKECHRLLREGRYLVVFSKDEFRDGGFFELSSEIARCAAKVGFKWVGKITWVQAGAPLRPYGLPFTYVPNFTDQKILVLKKGNGNGVGHT